MALGHMKVESNHADVQALSEDCHSFYSGIGLISEWTHFYEL